MMNGDDEVTALMGIEVSSPPASDLVTMMLPTMEQKRPKREFITFWCIQ